jgi:Allantoicase
LSIYPDGGVARLRVHGEVVPDPRLLCGGLVDLAALEHGGTVAECSDEFYGAPDNLIQPGLARTMGEGWETRRRRDSGNDWVVIRLAAPGRIRLAELDTSHFKGNSPGAVSLHGRNGDTGGWFPLLPERVPVQPDTRHRFPVTDARVATQVRLDVFPDGGLARLRLPGEIAAEDLTELGRRWWRLLPPEHARRVPETDALRYAG